MNKALVQFKRKALGHRQALKIIVFECSFSHFCSNRAKRKGWRVLHSIFSCKNSRVTIISTVACYLSDVMPCQSKKKSKWTYKLAPHESLHTLKIRIFLKIRWRIYSVIYSHVLHIPKSITNAYQFLSSINIHICVLE